VNRGLCRLGKRSSRHGVISLDLLPTAIK